MHLNLIVASILDNPIWHALETGNVPFAQGSGHAKYFKRDVGLFAGLKSNSKSDLIMLYSLLPEKSQVILFTPGDIVIPDPWRTILKKALLQMIYLDKPLPSIADKAIKPLQEKDIPAMLVLTAMTNPGPFFTRTIDFGNYEGIFDGDQLVAMAGQRLQPDPYKEISAVCTHPNHTGKGYAAKLIQSQIIRITAASGVPFLHVYPENPACKLYNKLGFQMRKEMVVYRIEK